MQQANADAVAAEIIFNHDREIQKQFYIVECRIFNNHFKLTQFLP